MKNDIMLTDEWELNVQADTSVVTLDKVQRYLLVGLGSILTYAVLTLGSSDPFFDAAAFGTVFLWLMLLFAPAAMGIVLYKFPSWQNVPLALRKNVILQSFGLSVLTMATTILFFLKWDPYQAGNWLFCTFITVCYGAIILRLHFRLARRVEDEKGELFP
ncbi:MAG: hypothetical protein DHS20C20_16470 [Ardenticatenaceae bacterium]|nr:MAG: hypothetical protein DHS20C20_16470 [Ardenticatenaceae bacterium]